MVHESHWFRPEIEAIASRNGIDPNLLEAIVRVESSGFAHSYRYEPGFFMTYLANDPAYDGANPRRVSSSYGLCQVMYPVAKELGFDGPPEGLFVPLVALEFGAKKLKTLIDWSQGNQDAAIAAYNGGKRGNEKAPYRNQQYLDRVKTTLESIRAGN